MIREVEPVAPSAPSQNLSKKYAWEHFANVWAKLQAFAMTEYKKIVLLDADMLVLQSIDDLFDVRLTKDQQVAASPACICNPMRNSMYPPTWKPEKCFYTYGDAGIEHDRGEHYFNSGMVVLEPCRATFDQLVDEVDSLEGETIPAFAEQDLLNHHYRDRWKPLSYRYNALKTLTVSHPKMWRLPEVRNIHYINEKPWDSEPGSHASLRPFESLDELWWNTWSEMSNELAGAPTPTEAACEWPGVDPVRQTLDRVR